MKKTESHRSPSKRPVAHRGPSTPTRLRRRLRAALNVLLGRPTAYRVEVHAVFGSKAYIAECLTVGLKKYPAPEEFARYSRIGGDELLAVSHTDGVPTEAIISTRLDTGEHAVVTLTAEPVPKSAFEHTAEAEKSL